MDSRFRDFSERETGRIYFGDILNAATGVATGKGYFDLVNGPVAKEGMRVGVFGNSGSGKSYLLGVVLEEVWRNKIPALIIDPNGDMASLREMNQRYGGEDIILYGNKEHGDPLRRANFDLKSALSHPETIIKMLYGSDTMAGFTVIVDLSSLDTASGEQQLFVGNLLQGLIFRAANQGVAEHLKKSVLVCLDEAHHYAPSRGADEATKYSLAKIEQISRDGRKHGIMLAIASQRFKAVSASVRAQINMWFLGKFFEVIDINEIKKMIGGAAANELKKMELGQFMLPTERGLMKIKSWQRLTTPLGSTPPPIDPNDNKNRASLKEFTGQQLKMNILSNVTVVPLTEGAYAD